MSPRHTPNTSQQKTSPTDPQINNCDSNRFALIREDISELRNEIRDQIASLHTKLGLLELALEAK